MFLVRSAAYLQRQVAKIVITAALVAVSGSLAYADAFRIEATFTGGVQGGRAKAAAFGGSKTCAESSQERGSCDPKREWDRRFSC